MFSKLEKHLSKCWTFGKFRLTLLIKGVKTISRKKPSCFKGARMKKFVQFFASIFVIFVTNVAFVSANEVKSLDFTAVTKTEKVIIDIDSEQKIMKYLTPSKDYNYTILSYDYNDNPDEKSYIFKGTVVDTMLNVANEVLIYSNDTFTDMRIGKRRITFTYVEEFKVKK